MAKSDKDEKTGSWFLTLFGGLFLAVGLIVGGLQARTIAKTVIAKSWVDTPAIVQSANLDVSYDSDGNTYRAKGTYQYVWQGDSYTSDRLFYGSGYDSQEKYHRKIVGTLKSKMRSGDPLTVKVNPRNPGQSVAFARVRWGMTFFMTTFALVFGGFGAGILFLGKYATGMSRRENARAEHFPDQPWLWRDEWQTSTIKNNSKAAFYATLFFAGIWNLISWPTAVIAWEEVFDKGNYLALLAYLFPAVGIGLGIWAWKSYQQWRRFGRTELVMETFPAALGSAVMARLRIFADPPPDVEFHVKLTCVRKETRGSGDDRRTVERMIWQDEQLIAAAHGDYGAVYELPIRFALPADEPASSVDMSGDPYIWRLTVKAEAGFTDMDQRFDIPVFDPTEYKFHVPASAQLASGEGQSRFEYKGRWERTGVIYSDDGGGHYYFFPAARHKGMAIMTSIVALVMSGIGIAPFFTDMPIIFGVIFGLFGILMLIWTVNMWLHKSAVDIADGILTIRRGLFRGRYRDIPADAVSGLELESSMSSGETKYYDIHVRLNSGDKHKIADHLLGRRDVENLMGKISTELGLPVK